MTDPPSPTSELHPRFVAGEVREALLDTPVVALNGARQVGKSTLVERLLDRSQDTKVLTLDDATQLEAARGDPTTFVEHDGLLVIDEVQRAPGLFQAVKAAVDRDRRPGRFLLTGSTRLLSVPDMSESLAGRVDIVDLWPLSQGELAGHREDFVSRLLSWDDALFADSDLARRDYMDRVCAGGYPEPLGRTGRRRRRWYANYVTTVIERMVAETSDIQRLSTMPVLFRLCAARTGNELNIEDVARDLELPRTTVSTYLTHLRSVFVIHLLPAWSRNLTSKVVHRPKLLVADTGLAAHLMGTSPEALSDATAPAGPLLETFVAMELRKQLGWSEEIADLYHYRDRGGVEVDLVVEADDGRVACVEVKSSATVRGGDFKSIRLFEDRLGSRFAAGVVLYTGHQSVRFGPKLAALPLARLWEWG